jgi:hypothetical protein
LTFLSITPKLIHNTYQTTSCWPYNQMYAKFIHFSSLLLLPSYAESLSPFWTQGLHLEPLPQPFLWRIFFKIRSCELFAWAGFELQSSWSLPPE